jgi:hypothetical protein
LPSDDAGFVQHFVLKNILNLCGVINGSYKLESHGIADGELVVALNLMPDWGVDVS